jgi:hypothetical protein
MNTLTQYPNIMNPDEKATAEAMASPSGEPPPAEQLPPAGEPPTAEELQTVEELQPENELRPAKDPLPNMIGIGSKGKGLPLPGDEASMTNASSARLVEFTRLDKLVKTHATDFREIGAAFIKIIEEQLWAIVFMSWEEYCGHLIGYDIVHIGRLVYAEQFVRLVEATNKANPKKKMPLPLCELQVRAIPRKLAEKDKLTVWRIASEEAAGVPTHAHIEKVRMLMFPNTKETKPSKKQQKIAAAIREVEVLLDGNAPVEEIKSAVNRLSEILNVDTSDGGSSQVAEVA